MAWSRWCIPAAFELSGSGERGGGEGFVSLLKKGVILATRGGRRIDGSFAALWKRRLSITARTAMMCQAHSALRKHHLVDDLCDYEDMLFEEL